jgi:hypothetical protein
VVGIESILKISEYFVSFLTPAGEFYGFLFRDSASVISFEYSWKRLLCLLGVQEYTLLKPLGEINNRGSTTGSSISQLISLGSFQISFIFLIFFDYIYIDRNDFKREIKTCANIIISEFCFDLGKGTQEIVQDLTIYIGVSFKKLS